MTRVLNSGRKEPVSGSTRPVVVFLHGYAFQEHERQIGELAYDIGYEQISLSHQVMPMVKMVARGDTTTVDAYLTPHIQNYLESFRSGFSDNLKNSQLLFMQSDGGLTDSENFKGSNAILSGPAGGVVGYAMTSSLTNEDTEISNSNQKPPKTGHRLPVIGFDMGGTSTDVSRYGDDYELVDVREVSDKNSDVEDWANSKIKKKLSRIQKFADFIKSKPNEESKLDKSYYKIRYTYQERKSSDNSRDFCKTMMGRTSKGVVYRKEDIDNASFQGVNNNFGHKGQNYSLFKFKGGIYCGHFWQEELYRMKSETEKYISKGKEVDTIPNSYQPKGSEYKDAAEAPIDMKNRGAYPN